MDLTACEFAVTEPQGITVFIGNIFEFSYMPNIIFIYDNSLAHTSWLHHIYILR